MTITASLSVDAGQASVRSVYIARALREFCDGFVAVLLPVYLIAIGLGPFEIGVIAATAMFGSAILSLGFGVLAARRDLRLLLLCGAGMMVVTGLGFALSNSYALTLLVACVGTINPSAGSGSVFGAIEQAVLTRSVADRVRTHIFARYSLIGAGAGAIGALASGVPDLLAGLGLSQLAALQGMFVLYAVLGLVGGVFYACIPAQPPEQRAEPTSALGPSRRIVIKMAALFSIDSLGSGFAVQSLVALWLFSRFDVSLATAGVFFFWTGIASALSFPVAAWLAGKIGLINTMVYTHIPSSLCLIGAAVAPNVELAFGLLLMRAALSQMDVPTRASYVMAVVTPPERAAAASITSVSKSFAAAASPALGGALFAAGYEAWPLIICGLLKIFYDFALLWTFRHVKPPEER